MTTRAKFRCQSVEYTAGIPGGTYKFQAMYDPSIPEERQYAQYTPSGSLTIHVDNPNVHFETGQSYYLDITPV